MVCRMCEVPVKLARIYTEKGLRLESTRTRVTSIHRESEKGSSRKLGFWRTKFSKTELPVLPILGNSMRRSAGAPLYSLVAGQAHLFIVGALH